MVNCSLCNSQAVVFHTAHKRDYYRCGECMGIFVDQAVLPDSEKEKNRYLMHQDPADDKGYAHFVSPLINAVAASHYPGELGLDFGSGADSFICKHLEQLRYSPQQYDPFFQNDPRLLQQQYDFIVCCEVMEHFHKPQREFQLLRKLLRPGGKLYCMTHLYSEDIDFKEWYYIRDFTHVFFYSHQTIAWIMKHFEFRQVTIEDRLIIFST